LHKGLLIAGVASGPGPPKVSGGEPRGFIQPAGEHSPVAQSGRLFGKDEEDRLGHVLRVLGVGNATQRDGVNQIDVTTNQLGKGRFRFAAGVFPHQVHVFHLGHLLIIPRPRQTLDIYFLTGWRFKFRCGTSPIP
jgi:hypothetical protein